MTSSMGEEKQRISERLARLDAEREKLDTQLDELETNLRGSDVGHWTRFWRPSDGPTGRLADQVGNGAW
jgi:hypothetical protein